MNKSSYVQLNFSTILVNVFESGILRFVSYRQIVITALFNDSASSFCVMLSFFLISLSFVPLNL
jgi:hypothetical protein